MNLGQRLSSLINFKGFFLISLKFQSKHRVYAKIPLWTSDFINIDVEVLQAKNKMRNSNKTEKNNG